MDAGEPEQILVPLFGCLAILTEDNALFRHALSGALDPTLYQRRAARPCILTALKVIKNHKAYSRSVVLYASIALKALAVDTSETAIAQFQENHGMSLLFHSTPVWIF